MAGLEKRVFLICPVRGVTQAEQIELADYVRTLEDNGCRVHYPPRDTNQDDPVGDRICRQNRDAILAADEVHVYWVNGETTQHGKLLRFRDGADGGEAAVPRESR